MLNRSQKENVVATLIERFRRQRISIFTDFRGMSVAKLTQFRRELRKVGAEFKVAKKTLLKRALEAVGINTIEPKELDGEIGVIFGFEDPIAPAKAAAAVAKNVETFKILKGILGMSVLEGTSILALAKLPPREVLLAQVARAFQSPLRGLAVVLQGDIRNLVVVLNKISQQK